jgi:hypothetical protein
MTISSRPRIKAGTSRILARVPTIHQPLSFIDIMKRIMLEPHQAMTARQNCSTRNHSCLVLSYEATYTDQTREKTCEKHDQSWLVLSGPVETSTSYSKDGELHSGWLDNYHQIPGRITVPLSSHHHVVKNSRAPDSVHWCRRFLTKRYSSQSKILTA